VVEAPAPSTELSRSFRLLSLIRKLIDYGRELVNTVPGRPRPAAVRAPAAQRGADRSAFRRRSMGDVIGDICRDFGITGSHPLWRELHLAMTRHCGGYVRLVQDIIDRACPLSAQLLSAATPAASQ
jgi:hypothetical protein